MPKKILLIDDDPLVLKTLENLFKRAGRAPFSVKSVTEAKEKLKEYTPDLIITDIRMPAQDGISFAKELKAGILGTEAAQVPLIFITGYASEEAPVDAVKLGARDYILKPFDLDALLASVEECLG